MADRSIHPAQRHLSAVAVALFVALCVASPLRAEKEIVVAIHGDALASHDPRIDRDWIELLGDGLIERGYYLRVHSWRDESKGGLALDQIPGRIRADGVQCVVWLFDPAEERTVGRLAREVEAIAKSCREAEVELIVVSAPRGAIQKSIAQTRWERLEDAVRDHGVGFVDAWGLTLEDDPARRQGVRDVEGRLGEPGHRKLCQFVRRRLIALRVRNRLVPREVPEPALSGASLRRFVVRGEARHLVTVDEGWTSEMEELHGRGTLRADRSPGAADFRMRLRLAIEGDAGSEAGLRLGDGFFGFDGGKHRRLFIEGPIFAGHRRSGRVTRALFGERMPFDLEIRRVGGELRVRMGGRTVEVMHVQGAIGPLALESGKGRLRVRSWELLGTLETVADG